MSETKTKDDIEARRLEVARRTYAGESEREIARALKVSRTTVWTDKQVNAAAPVVEPGVDLNSMADRSDD